MKKNYQLLFSVCILLAVTYFITKNTTNNSNSTTFEENYDREEESEEEEAYERVLKEDDFVKVPAFVPSKLTAKELRVYLEKRKKLEASGYQFTKYQKTVNELNNISKYTTINKVEEHVYANNKISGSWQQKNILTKGWRNNNNGFRADGSVYDPVNKELYVVSYAGHLYKIDESKKTSWILKNHKKNFKGNDFNGINLPSGAFRLLNQQNNGGMEFSDDEGRTWTTANGAYFQNSWNFKTLVTKTKTGRRIVAHGGKYNNGIGYDHIYISSDYGLNYTVSSLNFKQSDYVVQISKPHNSNSVYCFARRKSDAKLSIYKMDKEDDDFSLLFDAVQKMWGLDTVHGTLVNGVTHFYISHGKNNIFYSSDEGLNWTKTAGNSGRNLEEIHPTQPNICFKGFVNIFMSKDYGATWNVNPKGAHELHDNYVWDLQHMKTYDEEDGSNFTFVGMDFGSYYTSNSSDWESWVSVNSGSPVMMCYDMVATDTHNKIYTANQDRGSQGIIDNKTNDNLFEAYKEAPTDILRVALANNESSIWYWYYYGTIGRNDVVNGGGQNNITKKDFYGNWWASSMIGSPNKNEDAVYVATGNSLDKFTYNGTTIVKTTHPYNFGEPIISFAYSKLNTNLWYVGLKSGPFMYSKDGGNTFKKSTYTGVWPGQENSHKKRKTVILDSPTEENTVYYAGKGNYFLISKDGGISFTNHSTGLSVTRITSLDASPNGKFIFAASNNGPWVYAVDQDRWFKMTGPEVPELVEWTSVKFIPSKNIVRFATYGSGILDFKINENSLSTETNSTTKPFKLKAYPNPSNGIFKLYIPTNKEKIDLAIYNQTGVLVLKSILILKDKKATIDLTNLASGFYFAKINLNGKTTSIKLIKN